MKKVIIFSIVAVFSNTVFFTSCNNSKPDADGQKDQAVEERKALTLLHQNCFTCHTPDMVAGKRVAPPMFMVRRHYFDSTITEEKFIDMITSFVTNPTIENSIMPGAIRNFGLMPKQMFKEDDVRAIAKYIYHNDLDSDEWYAKWEEFKKSTPAVDTNMSYEDMGLKYANGAKSELGKNLLAAIKDHGADGAVQFCNTRAIPLTDSMAKVYSVSLKRVSDKPRNPQNAANNSELAFINEEKLKLANGEKLTPKVFEHEGRMIGYYPIQTNKMCLQCHGKKDIDINSLTYETIRKYYPEDKATGYGENEIRGLFVVEMAKK